MVFLVFGHLSFSSVILPHSTAVVVSMTEYVKLRFQQHLEYYFTADRHELLLYFQQY